MTEFEQETAPRPVPPFVKGAVALLACAGVAYASINHDTSPTTKPEAKAFMSNLDGFTPVQPYDGEDMGASFYDEFCNVTQDDDSYYSTVSAATDVPPMQYGKYSIRQYVPADKPAGFDFAPDSQQATIGFHSGYTNEAGEFSGSSLIRNNLLTVYTDAQNIRLEFTAEDAPSRTVSYSLQEGQAVSGESDMIDFGIEYRAGHFLVGLACSKTGTVDIMNARTQKEEKVNGQKALAEFNKPQQPLTPLTDTDLTRYNSVVFKHKSNEEITNSIMYYADQMNKEYDLPPYGQNYHF